MILHPELFTYKALVSGLEITEVILLQVNFNLSLYVLCNCYFNNFFKLLFYMYLRAQQKNAQVFKLHFPENDVNSN